MKNLSDEEFERIALTYRGMITTPSVKGVRFLLCPVGLVGSGKTTILTPLARRFGLVRVSTDEIRKLLKEKDFNWDRVEELALAVGDYFLVQGFGIAVDADCARNEKVEKIEKRAEELRIPIIWIHVNPPEKFILAKLKAYPHTWLFKNGREAIENYQARKPLHQNLSFDFAYVFDPSRRDLQEQIEQGTRAIEARLQNIHA